MDSKDLGPKDYTIIGLTMGLLKSASLRIMGNLESELTWWESYGVYTVLGLLAIAIHGSLRRFLGSGARNSDTALSDQQDADAESFEGKR
jgi:hypothetical protein